jgi:hypothetical protein
LVTSCYRELHRRLKKCILKGISFHAFREISL